MSLILDRRLRSHGQRVLMIMSANCIGIGNMRCQCSNSPKKSTMESTRNTKRKFELVSIINIKKILENSFQSLQNFSSFFLIFPHCIWLLGQKIKTKNATLSMCQCKIKHNYNFKIIIVFTNIHYITEQKCTVQYSTVHNIIL